MNSIILCGRVTADPELKQTQSGKSVVSFNLAVERDFKTEGGDTADFFNCTVFGKIAEAFSKYISKGKKVLVQGSMQNANYEKDGVKHYGMKCIVNKWEFADGKADAPTEEAPKKTKSEPKPAQTQASIEDDVPFF